MELTQKYRARCTSAAPWSVCSLRAVVRRLRNFCRFFSPKRLINLGTFQDGGLRHNNPINIAMWEHGFIRSTKETPDFVLSLGTGTLRRAGNRSSPVRDRFFQRLFKSFMLSMDGEKIWDDFYQALTPQIQSRFHRLNIELDSSQLGIDDISSIKQLEADAVQYMDSAALIGSLRDSMYASLFYFEFDGKPNVEQRQVVCAGCILLRPSVPSAGRRVLYHQLLAASAFFTVDGRSIPCIARTSEKPPPYRKPVRFTLSSTEEEIDITINSITKQAISISGLPRKAKDIVDAQCLDCAFGRADHVPTEKRLPIVPIGKRKADNIA